MEKVFLFGCNNIRKEGFFFRMKDSRSRGSTVFLWNFFCGSIVPVVKTGTVHDSLCMKY